MGKEYEKDWQLLAKFKRRKRLQKILHEVESENRESNC
jgi:hypothetical protein